MQVPTNLQANLIRPLVAAGLLIVLWVFILATTDVRLFFTATDQPEPPNAPHHLPQAHLPAGYHSHLAPAGAAATSFSKSPGKDEDDQAGDAGGYDVADRALIQLCKKTKWVDGLWLSCHSGCGPNKKSICGGLNNARNRIQTCMRLAIDIGAGVNFPFVTQRPEDNWGATNRAHICPDVWWDMERLKDMMAERCPGLKIASCQEDPNDINREIDVEGRNYKDRPHYNSTFRDAVGAALSKNNIPPTNVTADSPLLLRYQDSHVAWDYRDAGELATLRKSLFRVLQFNRTLLAVGDDLFGSAGLHGGNFIGVHLRAEYDWPHYWGTPERQMEQHAAEAVRTRLTASEPVSTIYVSCADKNVIQKFRDMMAPHNFTVTDKWTLFKERPDMVTLVDGLPFDQKAIVEYAVLVKGRYFQGNLISTMSSLIAYARTKDQTPEFFETYIYPDTYRWGIDRWYAEPLTMKGDNYTKEFVINGQDIMDAFP